jgi:3',5'-cyclic AMP phosphodiesterase CpdA
MGDHRTWGVALRTCAKRSLIVQVSDLHLSDSSSPWHSGAEYAKLVSQAVARQVTGRDRLVVAICGDLTHKGNDRGYVFAEDFIKELRGGLEVASVVCCPGNHDLCGPAGGGNRFAAFNRLVQANCAGNHPLFDLRHLVAWHWTGELGFVLANSSYHGDHQFGRVDLGALSDALHQVEGRPFVFVAHHHLVPIHGDNCSVVRNGLDVLQLLLDHSPVAVLHGHRHLSTGLKIGNKRVPVVGAGSLGGAGEPGASAQFNLLSVRGRTIKWITTYRLIPDAAGRVDKAVFSPSALRAV